MGLDILCCLTEDINLVGARFAALATNIAASILKGYNENGYEKHEIPNNANQP